jgi:hypothetical protein
MKATVSAELIQPILDTPSLSPATRLALSGERIMQNARDIVVRGEMDIERAYRRRRD